MSPDHPTRNRDRLTIIAMVFDLVATLGLCLVFVGAYVRGEALGLIFLGGAIGLAAIPGVALSALALRRAARRRGWPRGRSSITVAGLALAAVLIGPVVLAVGWSATPNPAAAAAAPLEREIRSFGGTPLCTNGDPGRGPDNVTPWHESYFTLPRDRASQQQLDHLAGSAGFTPLHRTTDRAPSGGESQRFTSHSDPRRPSADLAIEVSPTGTQLDCDPTYGRTYHPASNHIVVDLTTTIDSTQ